MGICGFKNGYSLKDYQEPLVKEILDKLMVEEKSNIFISLPQGTGKTIIALAALSELINVGTVRKVLVSQWVDRAQEMFYGLGLIKSPTLSKEQIERIRGWPKHSGAVGIAMTMQSFKNFIT